MTTSSIRSRKKSSTRSSPCSTTSPKRPWMETPCSRRDSATAYAGAGRATEGVRQAGSTLGACAQGKGQRGGLCRSGFAHERAAPEPAEFVWLDDTFPENSRPSFTTGDETNRWVSGGQGQVFSADRALRISGTNLHEVTFTNAAPLVIRPAIGCSLMSFPRQATRPKP